MTELRLHRRLYRGESIDEALKLYARYATFEQVEDGDYWVVRVTGKPGGAPAREGRVAGELANYALGLTIVARDKAARAG